MGGKGGSGMEIKVVTRAPGVQEPADDDQRYLTELDLSLRRQRKMLEPLTVMLLPWRLNINRQKSPRVINLFLVATSKKSIRKCSKAPPDYRLQASWSLTCGTQFRLRLTEGPNSLGGRCVRS